MANGSMSAGYEEGKIRQAIVEADLVDCVVALPGQLFYSTPIPVCLWFLRRNRTERLGETLFIDARQIGQMVDRTHKILDKEDIEKIAETYHAWRDPGYGGYEDIAGFCASAESDVIASHDHVLTPGRYVGLSAEADDGEPFKEKVARLTDTYEKQADESLKLSLAIRDITKILRDD
jgi:type I restriction enzyme M protein